MSESPVKDGYVKGSLAQVPFPKVLNFINQAGKSGILALSHGKRKVHIHFGRGEIVYVTSSYFPEMTLGDYLMKQGKISLQVQEDSLNRAREQKMKQGAYLVEKGFLSPHDLYTALNQQVLDKLYKLFSWTEGEFYFREGEIVAEEHRIINISFPNLLFRGIRSHMPLSKPPIEFRGRKENKLIKRMVGRFKVEDLRLAPSETRIYNLINSERTLRQIVALSNMSKAAAFKVLYALFLLEMIGFPESAKADQIVMSQRGTRTPAADRQGYEIAVSDDLFEEAMAGIDRIKEEVKRDTGEIEIDPLAAAARLGLGQPKPRVTPAPDKPLETPSAVPPDVFKAGPPTAKDEMAAGLKAEPLDEGFSDTAAFDMGEEGLAPGNEEKSPSPSDADWEAEPLPVGGQEELEPAAAESMTTGFFADIDDFSNAEDLIKQAHYLIDEGQWDKARQFLEKALELEPSSSDAFTLLGWTIFNGGDQPNRVTEAEGTIKKGLKLNPKAYLPFLYLGKIYAELNQYDFAELHFVKALELNVECSEAKEEIKRIRNR